MSRNRKRRFGSAEQLEPRRLLAVGPLIHTHNRTELAVVDSGSGQLETLARFSGFVGSDDRMSDIAFSSDSRLYGIAANNLYEINPVTAALTALGAHGIPSANALVFDPNGALRAMGPTDGGYYELTITDTDVISRRTSTVSGLAPGVGSGGDIAFMNGDLILASSDDRLLWYRFDVDPNRPRIIADIDLADLGVSDVFGLAVVDDGQLIATGDREVISFDVSNLDSISAEVFRVSNQSFGNLRGAAFYAEAGGDVPVGTMAGTKWRDIDGDGFRQLIEPVLSDWQVYVDTNLNGVYDTGEPTQTTDDEGRYYFYGYEPGLYTVDEIILDPLKWEQTFPRTPNRNLVGVYKFDSGTAVNTLFHDFGLPTMSAIGVNMPGTGTVSMVNAASYLELPVALGSEPFTIAIDATYRTDIFTDKYLVSQRANEAALDFRLITEADSRDVAAEFCTRTGTCNSSVSAPVENESQAFGITWNGISVGAYSDDALVTSTVGGTQSNLRGDVVRFGNPTNASSPVGAQGAIHEIRIYNKALSEAELDLAFVEIPRSGAYSVYVDDTRGVDGLDFGNHEPEEIITGPEITVTVDGFDGMNVANGDTVSLGRVASIDEVPEKEFWIHNDGNDPLTVTIDESAGFAVIGEFSRLIQAGASTSFIAVVTDDTPGVKTGSVTINNNDEDEDPFVINLIAEIIELDTRPRELLINTAAGRLMKVDQASGAMTTLMSEIPRLTDIAHHPTQDLLIGIDATTVYELDRVADRAVPLFVHGVPQASALGFSPLGELFAAGRDVYQLDLDSSDAEFYAAGGSSVAGDIAALGTRLLMSTTDGGLYEIADGQATHLTNVTNNVSLNGLVASDTDSLVGFSDNQTYLVNPTTGTLSPRFNTIVFTIAGATYQPVISAHNVFEPLDVDGNGVVAPLDALLIINELNARTFTDASGRMVATPSGDAMYPDVDNNGFVTPFDAISVINFLNERAAPAVRAATDAALDSVVGEAEGELINAPLMTDLAAALANDDAHIKKSRRPTS